MFEISRPLLACIFAFSPVIYTWVKYAGFDPLPGIGFSLMLMQSAWIIFLRPGDGGTLVKTYFLFMYIFVGMVPFLAYANNITFLGARSFTSREYVLAIFSLIIANQIFYSAYLFYYNRLSRRYVGYRHTLYAVLKNRSMRKQLTRSSWCFVFVLAGSAAFIQLSRVDFSVAHLLYRNVWDFGERVSTESIMFKMMLNIVRYSPAVFLIYVLANYRRAYLLKVLLCVFTLVNCFPTGIPRFVVAALYLPMVFIILPVLVRSFVFPLLLIFGMFYVFPVLNRFRHHGFSSSSTENNWLFQGHFDSFQSYIFAVNGDIITFGKQFLGVLFFFVPRAFWPDKPVSSGMMLAQEHGLTWLNSSASVYTEGYVNFGFFGVIFVAFALGLVCAKMDSNFKFQFAAMTEKQSAFYIPFYLILLGYTFLFLRGDMMTALSALITFTIPLLVIHFIACKT